MTLREEIENLRDDIAKRSSEWEKASLVHLDRNHSHEFFEAELRRGITENFAASLTRILEETE